MRILIVFCHPYEQSFNAALFECARKSLSEASHELRTIDLYREGFDPVMQRSEWLNYFGDAEKNIDAVRDHVDAVRWAEGLVLVYPTWIYGPPSMLKGWIERVWLPGVAFDAPEGPNQRLVGRLRNIRFFVAITTGGSPRWWTWFLFNPGFNALLRGHKPLFHRNCRMEWLQLYDMDHQPTEARTRFLRKVEKRLKTL